MLSFKHKKQTSKKVADTTFKAYKSLKPSLWSTIFNQNLLNIVTILREKKGIDDFNLLSGKNDAATVSGLLAANNLIFLNVGNGLFRKLGVLS